jgi:hypothetical protein
MRLVATSATLQKRASRMRRLVTSWFPAAGGMRFFW